MEAGWVSDERTANEWIGGLARDNIGALDLPIVARLRCAWIGRDERAVEYWSTRILASRETEELRAEDRHMGQALARILLDLGVIPSNQPLQPHFISYGSMFACACAAWSVPERETLQTYAWTWIEGQTLAAVKVVPLGQSAGQRILHALIPELERIVEDASQLRDEDIAAGSVMQAFASAKHEQQYTRLFRS